MLSSAKAAIVWLPWSAGAFERACAERKPVLLSIVTTWSRGCAEMDRTSYADPIVAGLIADRFVPVRVDADRRPDISGRYTLGGWPTTAFLTPDGEILGGGTFVSAERFPSILTRVVDAFEAGRPDSVPRAEDDQSEASAVSVPLEQLEAMVIEHAQVDAAAGAGAPRFPQAAPIHLLLHLIRGDAESPFVDLATTCLDAMGWGGLYDDVDGGFFRYANESDWTRPQSEKLLDVNASLLSLYLDAFETLRLARYAERAEDVLGYVQQTFADAHDGGWASSQQEDSEYYALPDADARAARAAPVVDRTLLSGPNATMVSAALRAARVFEDEGLRAFAIRSLERVVLRHYRPGGGVARCIEDDQDVRGLLDDQIAMASAHIDAYDVTEDIVYEMMAEELARQAVGACWDTRSGGFLDRAPADQDIGLLRRRQKPFVGNCEAARMLYRLAKVSGDSEYAAFADGALQVAAAEAARQGPLAAHYVLAMREARLR